jgi:uncharacterized membrane protein YhhN
MAEPLVFPWAEALPALLLTAVAVTALVASDLRDWRPGRYLFKPLAALGFLWLAVLLRPEGSAYATWLLAGLVLCAVGDLLLMFEHDRSFLAGLLAFLCGHLLYILAFLQINASVAGMTLSLLPVAVLVVGSLRWLLPHLQGPMRIAVPAYIVVIAAMLLAAGGTVGARGWALVLAGAWGFAISDLAVARRQFVKRSIVNGLWGTPLYFGSQLLLAASLAFH